MEKSYKFSGRNNTIFKSLRGFKKVVYTMIVSLFMLSGNNLSATDYYWVGGTGNWSDISHWVTTSGGIINHMQVPGPFDDVYFDHNSFTAAGQTVTVNAGNYQCKSMDWTGAQFIPTFKNINGYNLKIYGSLTLIPAMTFNYIGIIYFEGLTNGFAVTSAGHSFKGNVYFNGFSGGWTLADSLNVGNNSIYMNYGSLNTNNQLIRCGSFYSQTTSARTINLGTSVIYASSSFRLNTANLNLNAGSSVINLTSTSTTMNVIGGGTLNNVNSTNNVGTTYIVSSGGTTVFNNVVISNNSNITGNNTYGNLTLAGINNLIKEGSVQTIIGNLNADGTCASLKYIKTAIDTLQASLVKTSGAINLNYVVVKGINANGGASFNAVSSVDLGNNSGWNISGSASNNLYWVGGTGNWDDPLHWALSSGGAGGTCVPTPYDNVFFDANSFTAPMQSVNINCPNAFCHDMTWTGVSNSPTFAGLSSNTLYIYGSLFLDPNMNLTFNGPTYFKSYLPGNTVLSANQVFGNHVYFDRPNGGWILADNLSAGSNVIYLVAGSLNLDNHNVTCASFNSGGTTSRSLLLGTATVTLTSSSSYAWTVNNTNLMLEAQNSTILFTGAFGGMYNTGIGDTMKFNVVNFMSSAGTASLNSATVVTKINSSVFSGDGLINGTNVFNDLSMMKTFYQFGAGKTVTVKNSLITNGNCASNVYMYSSLAGSQANLVKYGSPVVVDYVILKDMNASGASFTANNSTDLGNNTGWTINAHAPYDLYWVGGTGNWNDPMHWSNVSGGPGGYCIPSPVDNVFFDVNSFTATGQSVDVNVPQAYCNNMTWTGVNFNPEFKTSLNSNMLIYGSLVLSPNMNHNYGGMFMFSATTPGKTITSGGRQFKNSVYFCGIGGSWTLNDAFNATKSMEFVHGTFNSNDQDINTFSFISSYTNPRVINLGTSNITVSSNSSVAWYILGLNLTLDADQSKIKFTKSGAGMRNTYGDTLRFNRVHFIDTTGISAISNSFNYVKFVDVFFRSDGIIEGWNSFDTLSFYPSKTYTLESSRTQTINDVFNCSGNGCFPITLRSSVNGTQSSIFKSSGTVSVSYVDMRDQNAFGGASFFAGNNSVNLANNTGWVFGNNPGFIFGLPDTAFVCPGDTLVLSTFNFVGGVSFEWQDASTSSTYNVTQPGKYWVEVTYADQCFVADTVLVFNNELPYAATSSDTAVCSGSPLTLWVSGNGDTYEWSNSSTSQSISVNPTNPTTYFVSVTNVCGVITDSITVSIHPGATANAGQDTMICSGASASLHATGLPGSNYEWSNGSAGACISVSPATTTTYTVSVTDQYNCSLATDDITVFVVPMPFVNAGPDAAICMGGSQTLTASTNNAHVYMWSNGATVPVITVSPITTTTYYISVSDSLGCNTVSDSVIVTVNYMPSLDAGSDTALCYGNAITLNAIASDATSYLWSNAATTASTIVNPLVNTIYYVNASNNCGTTTDSVFVEVYPLATADAGHDTVICNGSSITLVASGLSGSSYQWSNGVSGEMNLVNPVSTTSYMVSVTDQHACNVATDNVTVYIMPVSYADASPDTDICSGNGTTLTVNAPAGSVYNWSNGQQTQSVFVNPVSSTLYYVTVSDTLGCTTATDSVMVNVNYAPLLSACNDVVVCPGAHVMLTAAGSNASNYTWDNGYTGDTIYVGAQYTITYTVSLSNNCGSVSDQVTVSVIPPSYAYIGPDITICSGNLAVLFADSHPGSVYTWSTSESTQSITVNPLTNTTYSVTVTDTLNCSTATDEIMVNVASMPLVSACQDVTVCEGELVLLNAYSPTTGNYSWSTGDTGQMITIVAGTTTVYTVSVSNICGVASDNVTVNVNPKPQIQLSKLDAHCDQPNGTLYANGGVDYLWSNGATTATVNNVPAGTYTVTVSNGDCVGSDTITLVSIPGPIADFYASTNTVYVSGGEIDFHDQSSGDVNYWKWNFGDGAVIENIQDPAHQYNLEGEYTVVLWVKDAYNCIDSATQNINVVIPNTLSVPNAFSPNSDGLNDHFGPVWYREEDIVNYQMIISDRWGKIIFETNDLKTQWDGKNGNLKDFAPQGIYTWVIKYDQKIEDRIVSNNKAGIVTLLSGTN